jgi:hypothetical protein
VEPIFSPSNDVRARDRNLTRDAQGVYRREGEATMTMM